ncbi:MAG: type IV toxin-antitoxin system AbiEi family antitoxin domain-containing protein [Alphaproteobacteria bacterium]|nr:type IV toxin-antitoxin system AbiEi family antitoxin domain-containing protein [Alphaproteobacteria bacterium]
MNLGYTTEQLGISQSERLIIDSLIRLGKQIVRADDLEEIFGYTRSNANSTLSKLCRKGWLQRLKSGVYRVVPLGSASSNPVPDDAWAIAMEVFSPCYISGWTSAEHWDLTEQIFNLTIVFTGQKLRKSQHNIANLSYITKFIDRKKIFGTKKIWSSNTPVQIADIHRTVIDVLDDPHIGGGGRHTLDILRAYWKKEVADLNALLEYAEKLNHGAIFRRLGATTEIINKHVPDVFMSRIQSRIKTGIINFDPSGNNSGPILTKWGVRMNLPSGDIL